MAGDWTGRAAPLHFDALTMRFTQHGDVVQGIACYVSENTVIFRDIPVRVDNRNVSFSVPMDAPMLPGFTFSGTVASDGILYGEWSIQGDHSNRMSLDRGLGTYCGV